MHKAILGGEIHIRSESERLIDVRLLTYDEVAETGDGPEYHAAGAFDGIDPAAIVLRQDHEDPALGRGVAFEERDNAPYMTFRVDETARGDDLLRSIKSGTYTGASVGEAADRVIEYVRSGGRRIARVVRASLVEVSATWRPAYQSAAVVAVRSQEDEMDEEAQAVETASTAPDFTAISSRLEALEERSRADAIHVPEPQDADLSKMVRKIHVERQLADVITTGNEGVVPDALVNEMVGIIDNARPFLASTRRIDAPGAGTSLVLPKITQRPLVGEQLTEKTEVDSRATAISTVSFDMRTFAGAGDLSIQLIRRSSPQFLDLWTELLAEAYADVTDDEAVDALLAVAAVNEGTATFDPATGDISFGEAFVNAQAVSRRMFPDTLWLSTAAIAAMIDAKTDGTNTPMFGSLNLNADAGTGVSGTVSGLRAVHVPALDDEAVDAIIGPRRGFAWAEDGTYTLSADVPAKAGRDVGLVGMIWFAPIYPAAFTTYALAS
jgi:HK97 family phage prohead protease